MTKILIGCDPEVFVKRDGKNVSAHGLIQGTKTNPFMVHQGAVQVDGTALEFNIFPAETEDEFFMNIMIVLDQLRDMIPSDLEIVYEPTAMYDQDYFDAIPAFPKMLGCEPDFSAYTLDINPKPSTDKPMRTAGGHVHIGWGSGFSNTKDHMQKCASLVRRLDATLFEDSLSWDSDDLRREMYGAKGSFRPKHFGVEYRPLSCAWLKEEETIRHVYRTTYLQAELFLSGQAWENEEAA